MAVLNRNFNVVKTLVKHGAEIDAKSCTNETPTDLACERRLYDIGMVSHKMSIITIFGHKHFKPNLIKKLINSVRFWKKKCEF